MRCSHKWVTENGRTYEHPCALDAAPNSTRCVQHGADPGVGKERPAPRHGRPIEQMGRGELIVALAKEKRMGAAEAYVYAASLVSSMVAHDDNATDVYEKLVNLAKAHSDDTARQPAPFPTPSESDPPRAYAPEDYRADHRAAALYMAQVDPSTAPPRVRFLDARCVECGEAALSFCCCSALRAPVDGERRYISDPPHDKPPREETDAERAQRKGGA